MILDFHKIAVLNGHFLPVRNVRLDPTGGGVLSGWGVYSTVRIYAGRPFNVEAHVARLDRDARRVGITMPRAFQNVEADLADLARRNGLDDGAGRIFVLGGPVGRFSGSGPRTSDLLILTHDLRPRPPGESLWVAPYRVHTRNPLAGTKTTSNLPYIQCRREAMQNQFDEALILNESGHVAEISTGNLFWIRDRVLYTPSLATGCLEGSTRSLLLQLARDQGTDVVEGEFELDHLLAAQEAFVSSVSREVSPVARIDDHTFPEVPGAVSAALQEGFQSMLETWQMNVPATGSSSPSDEADDPDDPDEPGDASDAGDAGDAGEPDEPDHPGVADGEESQTGEDRT